MMLTMIETIIMIKMRKVMKANAIDGDDNSDHDIDIDILTRMFMTLTLTLIFSQMARS